MTFGLSPIDLGLKYGGFRNTEQTPDERKRLWKRRWRRIAGVLVILLLALVVFRVYGRLALNRQIEKLRAKGYPMTFAELEDYNRLPEGVPNAAEIYVKAFESYQSPTEDEKKLLPNLGSVVMPKELTTTEMKEAMAAFLERNAKTLVLLNEAGRIEQCRYEYQVTAEQGYIFPHLQEIRDCAQLLNQFILIQAEKGNSSEAIQAIIDGIQLGESLGTEPFLISYLVRCAIDWSVIGRLQNIVSKTAIDEQQMTQFRTTIQQLKGNLRLDQALIGEWSYQTREGDSLEYQDFGEVFARRSGLMSYNALRSFQLFARLEEAAAMNPAKRRTNYERVINEANQLSFFYFLTKEVISDFDMACKIDLRIWAQLEGARVVLAVERYRLAESRLPKNLEELVPKFIEAVPIDPFDGRPLRYKKREKGYTVYSIGEDGEDNGGLPKEKGKKGKTDDPFTVER